MEDLAVITALTHWGSFGKHLVERRKKLLPTSLGRSVLGKLSTLSKIRSHTLIGCYWQSIFYRPLFILSATPPPPPLYTFEEILLAVKPLDCPLWIMIP